MLDIGFLEIRSAVVEVGHPWSNVTVKRKLPPLKYYYDFEMSKHCMMHIYRHALACNIISEKIKFSDHRYAI